MRKVLLRVLLVHALSPLMLGEVGCESSKGRLPGAKGRIALKMDFALPGSEKDPTPVPGTLKKGWTPFVAARWADMYMHDAVWEDGSGGGMPPKTAGLAGSGVHVLIDCGGSGNGGFARVRTRASHRSKKPKASTSPA